MKHKISTLVIKKNYSHSKFKPHDVSFNDFYIHIFKFIVWDMKKKKLNGLKSGFHHKTFCIL